VPNIYSQYLLQGPVLQALSPSRMHRSIPNQLTDEQVAYVQNMYNLRVPVAAIAAVAESMLQEGETLDATPAPAETSTGGVGIEDATLPPSYEDL
jgi:hypothetical protein